jgi:hypothetical protein
LRSGENTFSCHPEEVSASEPTRDLHVVVVILRSASDEGTKDLLL